MDVMLQAHGAKDICQAPHGLSELCADISREVLREQPTDIYSFIADYVEALLITRENTRVAVKVVDRILQESEAIISVLYRSGFSLEKIAEVAPRLQAAFRYYVDSMDEPCDEYCTVTEDDEKNLVSIQSILQQCGTSLEEANRAATIIQKAFRRHYERMLYYQIRGEIQWQRAVMNTMQILKKAGVCQNEIHKTAPVIMAVYRGYYTRRNQRKQISAGAEYNFERSKLFSANNTIQAVAWLEMVSKESAFIKEEDSSRSNITESFEDIQNFYGKRATCASTETSDDNIEKLLSFSDCVESQLNIKEELFNNYEE